MGCSQLVLFYLKQLGYIIISAAASAESMVNKEVASEIWREFQHFAAHHVTIPSNDTERICKRFENMNISNFTKIDDNTIQRSNADKILRILFLTTKRSLLLIPDRWYVLTTYTGSCESVVNNKVEFHIFIHMHNFLNLFVGILNSLPL